MHLKTTRYENENANFRFQPPHCIPSYSWLFMDIARVRRVNPLTVGFAGNHSLRIASYSHVVLYVVMFFITAFTHSYSFIKRTTKKETMVITRPPPPDLVTYAYSLALAESKAKKDANRSSAMDPISEDEKPTDASAATTGGNLDESRKEVALHQLLKIVDENKIIIDDHLRRVISGQDEKYTSTDAVESIRRSSSACISISERRRSSNSKGSLINRSRRQLGLIFRKNSSQSDSGDKESGDTDSSISSAPTFHR